MPPRTRKTAPRRTPSRAPASEPLPDIAAILDSHFAAPSAPAELGPGEPLPARMLNEFVYCPRLFHIEHVQGLFLENADTRRGRALHERADSGSGALPSVEGNGEPPEILHARSVTLSSRRLGVIAKMDLIEVQPGDDLFAPRRVSPVDYKAGAPRDTPDGPALWDADKIQIALQCLILRDNGYLCDEGVIYYRATKQRITLPLTPETEAWVLATLAQARACAASPVPPPPLDASPKCVRCSLAPVCLPDETRFLQESEISNLEPEGNSLQPTPRGSRPQESQISNPKSEIPAPAAPRRLIAPRPDTRPLYLNTQGLFVGRAGGVLRMTESKGAPPAEVRLADVDHVALFGNIQISTQAVHELCQLDIPLTWFSAGGWFYGITRGFAAPNVHLRVAQFAARARLGTALPLARAFIAGKIRNQRKMLMRNHISPPADALQRLRAAAAEALRAPALPALLGIEGAAAALYFSHFAGMLRRADDPFDPADPPASPAPAAAPDTPPGATSSAPSLPITFDFQNRNRRPPRDPVNALLSLACSLLAKDCAIAALAVGFDPQAGFLHQIRPGRPALALDIMEEFRPLIADSAVLTALNNRMLTPAHFIRAGDTCNLTPAGRKIFFEVYERRMAQLIEHPLFGYKVCYRRAIELQFRILARVLTGEIPAYQPFLTR